MTGDLQNYHITAAQLQIFDAWAYSCATETFSVAPITESWNNTGNKSWPGPSIGSEIGSRTGGASVACPSSSHTAADPSVGQFMTVNLSTGTLNNWVLGRSPDYGLAVTASTSDSSAYKQFDGYNSPNPPYLALTYSANTVPQISDQFPPDNYSATSLTPELQAAGTDADSWPDPLTYKFTVEDASSTVVASSSWLSAPDWTVPAGKLAWNSTYYWYAEAYDGLDYSSVTVRVISTGVPQPTLTSALSQNAGGQGFDPANSNYTTSATDANVSVAGPALAIQRDYNSEDLRTGAFGAGWSSVLDMRADPGLTDSSGASATVLVTYPDGQQVGFGRDADGTFTAPPGRFATLAAVTGGYTLTDKNDTVYSFTESLGSGGYGISSITDAMGNVLSLSRNSSGQVTTMTSATSGRALHLTWSATSPSHVLSVAGDPVTPGSAATALTWTYGYSGNQLTQVCPPSSATACRASYQSISLWFKTTGSGVLFSYQNAALSSGTASDYTPSLYVGTNGHLYGEFWDGSAAPISTSAAVNDGLWHHAVLTGAGNTQTLYLDGQPVGSLSGAITMPGTQSYDYAGAGFIGGGWPSEPNSGGSSAPMYFTGNLSDVAFWNRALTPAEIGALRQAGLSQASLLTKITRPSGSVYAQIGYNGLTGAVTSVTDDNGGSWQVGAPADTGSSQVYVSSVLGAGPADYWRLADTGTSQAVNQVNGGVATYSNVTEGAAGPFSDATADSFNGTSSSVSLPASLVDATGGQSVSLWFKTSTPGGILFSYENKPLTSSTASDYTPALYLGPGGDLHGEFWNGAAAPIVSSSSVADGKWHNVVLAAGASSQALYLDGKKIGSLSGTITDPGPQAYDYVGAGFIGGGWPNEPNSGSSSAPDYYQGSVGEVAFYDSQLTAAQAAAEYNAAKNSSGLTPVQTVHVTDPGGHPVSYVMDPVNGNRLISQTDGLGHATKYGYDTSGFLYDVVDPDGNETITGHDLRGNAVSQTTCQDQSAGDCSTAYYSYYPDDTSAQPSPNPRNDLLLTERGPGSASAADGTYLTTYSYSSSGELTSQTTPPVTGFPQGRTTTTTYSDGTSAYPAADTGNAPAGLPVKTTSPGGAVTTTQYYHDGDVAQVTDPDGLVTKYAYDGVGRLLTKTVVSDSYPAGLITSYGYDPDGEVTSETDPPVTDRVTGAAHTARIVNVYDADGDVLSQTTSDLTGGDALRAVTNSYNSHDQMISTTDPAGGTTSYTYDGYGDQVSQTDPGSNVTNNSYDADGHLLTVTLAGYTGNPASPQSPAPLVESSRAYDPAGRLASVTNAMGFVTSYTYTDDGLLATATRGNPQTGASFTEQSNSYDAAGQLTQQVTNNGATTTAYAVDAAGRDTATTVDPAGLDRTTSYSYTPDDQVDNQTLTGPGSSSPVQATGYAYDPMGNLTSQSQYTRGGGNPAGWWRLDQTSGTAVPDASGTGNNATAANVTWSGGAGVFNGSTSQVATGGPVLNTTSSFSVSAWVNMSTAVAWEAAVSQDASQASAFQLQYDASTSGWAFGRKDADTSAPNAIRAVSTNDAAVGSWQYLTATYDPSTGAMTLYVNGTAAGTATDTTPYAANGPLVIGRGQYAAAPVDYFAGSVSDVQVYQRVLSASEISALYAGGRDGGANPASRLTTTWTLDKRGLPTSMTNPDGNTSHYGYDQAGELAVTTSPTVSTQIYGGAAVQTAPVTMTGYDTFGEPAETSDADGNVTTKAYDADGHPVSVTQPPYTPPGSSTPVSAVSTRAYNGLGEVTAQTDPLGNKTSYAYDQLSDVASVTAPDGGVTSYGYDANGDQLSVTGPTGAVSDATYDYLGRQVTATQVERYPSAAAYTSTLAYGTNGWLSSRTSAAGVVSSYNYDAAGETTRVTDGAGNATSHGYDAAGRQVSVTNPDSTSSTVSYDEAGRATGQADLSATGSVLRSGSSAYDNAGNLVSSTDYRGDATTFTYDATGLLAQEVQPVSAASGVTTSFGYDAAGNRTLFTDGNGNNWWRAYNSWNLPQSQVEPPTTANPAASQGTFSTAYDADGNPVSVSQPGGVSVSSTYNNMGELTGQSGSGADAATAARSFGYDLAGNLTSAGTAAAGSAPASSDSFTYDDRGLPLSASGTSGSSSFGYNGDGQAVSVTDAAGTTSYAYDGAGRLATMADPLTGTTAAYSYNPESQVSRIAYGTGNDVRSFGYDSLHELTSDTLATSGGAAVASVGYGYDANGNLTAKTTAGFAGSSASTYGYDEANRLTSWNSGTATTSYGYDGAGNRTQAGSRSFTFDARDELTSDGSSSYAYTARGTLSSVSGASGAQSFTSDAFGQAVTQAGQAYSYDALGRVLTDSGGSSAAVFSYSGAGNTIASDGTWKYTWDPSGTALAAAGPAGGTVSQGRLGFTDAHTDVTGDFAPSGSSLAGSASYDPWGSVTASSGLAGHLGYQSGWTDPGNGRVDMAARWYDPSAGGFTTRDPVAVSPVPASAAANPSGYAGDDPLTMTDPSGHTLVAPGGGGGYTPPPPRRSPPPPAPPPAPAPSCGWNPLCYASHAAHAVAHTAVHYYHVVQRVAAAAAGDAGESLRYLHAAIAAGLRAAGHLAREAAARIADAASAGAHAVAAAGRVVVSAGAGVAHAVTRYAASEYHHVAARVHTALHAVARVASAAADFVRHHAAAIASVVVSVAVFAGCDAALGIATGGVGAVAGAVACGALAGAAGNAVAYGITAAQTGKFSLSGLAESTAMGALAGGLTAGVLKGIMPGASAVSGLLSRGAASAAEEGASAAAASGAEATATAAGADTAASVADDTGKQAADGGGGWLGRMLAPRTTAYAHTAPEAAGGIPEPTSGQTLFRVYGGDSKAGGASWSPNDPRTVPGFRDVAGLPSGGASGATNTGRFAIEGELVDPSKVVLQRQALPLDGMKGGLPEYVIPNWMENGAIRILRVSGVNPEF